ncbi:MAG: radical SAM protein [Candidatus Methylomirabilales bacterium]
MMPIVSGLSSPDYVRLSLASAMALRIRSGRFYRDVHNGCINLLLTYPESCRARCAYCGLARMSSSPMLVTAAAAGGQSFIRVDWPTVPTEEVLARLSRHRAHIRRVCLSMVMHHRAYSDTLVLIRRLATEAGGSPLSALIAPPLVNEARLRELQTAGVERIGIGLDAASERVFGYRRPGLSWLAYWRTVVAARGVFGPDRVNCHLVVGLGETDAELVELCFRLRAMQVSSYLFSFYPEPGSSMARTRRPSLVRWRRLQLVTHLIDRYNVQPEQIRFDNRGCLVRLEIEPAHLRAALAHGEPFITQGCPGEDCGPACTRPFGSYRPGEPFRDYPFAPDPEDLQQIERQLRLAVLC